MNEEEKQALEECKILMICLYDYMSIEKSRFYCNQYKIILDLIYKQQEEIKARLKEIDSIYKMMSAKDDEIEYLADKIEQMKEDYQILKDDIEGHNIAYVDTPEFEENYISKDKIKEKIEEIENYNFKGNFDDMDFIQSIIQQFKELLGETND